MVIVEYVIGTVRATMSCKAEDLRDALKFLPTSAVILSSVPVEPALYS